MNSPVQSITTTGNNGTIVDIECHLSNNLPNIIIVGFANKAVDESRERIRGAFATSHIMLPRKRIIINLAPADIPKVDSGFDLAIAVAILQSSAQVFVPLDRRQAFIGELGLDGQTRAVRGIIGKVLVGRARGVSTFYIPTANLQQAQLVPKVKLIAVSSLEQLFGHLNGGVQLPTVKTGSGRYKPGRLTHAPDGIQLSEIVGQHQAKRALEIAAAGGHNLFFSGPPGTGKSMLAKALQSILPPLSREEVLEVTHLHSLTNNEYEQIVSQRPFRSPHHSASHAAMLGGGNQLRPGEISLAHRGVLFLDELPEFSRDTVEALRQPLEDRVINIARIHDRAQYPANFILIATANPCPCGYTGSGNRGCSCTTSQRHNYQERLSGPILDRIDLSTYMHDVEHAKLLTQHPDPDADDMVRQRVAQARYLQNRRYHSSQKLNTDMSSSDIKQFAWLESKAIALLNWSAGQANLSARSYIRTIRVARTIADLAGASTIRPTHVLEALRYRLPHRKILS